MLAAAPLAGSKSLEAQKELRNFPFGPTHATHATQNQITHTRVWSNGVEKRRELIFNDLMMNVFE